MNINEDSYILGLWFISWDGGDWLCQIYKRTAADAFFTIEYRFRYYGEEFVPGGDPFTDDDTKRWYSGHLAGDDEVVLGKAKALWMKIAAKRLELCSDVRIVDHLEVRGNSTTFSECAKKSRKSWLHFRQME